MKALFFEKKNGKPTGFFKKDIIEGSQIWKFPTKNGDLTYQFIGLLSDQTPVFLKIKSEQEIMIEGLDIIKKELENYL